MDLGTTNLLETLSERVSVLSNEGNWDDALSSVEAEVDKARDADDGGFSATVRLAGTLEIKADILQQQNYFEDSRVNYLEALEMLSGQTECTEMVARISMSLGGLYDLAENDEEAILLYEQAIKEYEKLGETHQDEVADICNNLGFIYRSLGNMDTAETLLLKGLEICYEVHGKNHKKTATLFNNVGALYLKSGYDEQAREMHKMALEGRIASLGEEHPDTAQSYANLALSLAQVGESEEAQKYFLKALDVFGMHSETAADDYEIVAENYAEFLGSSEGLEDSLNVS